MTTTPLVASVEGFLRAGTDASARVNAYLVLNEQLKSPDTEGAVECLSLSFQPLLAAFGTDVNAEQEDVRHAALRTLSYFLHHPVFSNNIPAGIGHATFRKIVDLVDQTSNRETCVLGLWCIAMQRATSIFEAFAPRAMASVEACFRNKWQSMAVTRQALEAAESLIDQYPVLAKDLIDKEVASKSLWTLFTESLDQNMVDTTTNIIQLFERMASLRANASAWLNVDSNLGGVVDNLLRFVDGKDKVVVFRAWRALVQLIPPADVARPDLLNPLLKVPTRCFRSKRASLRLEGYGCWKLLIGIFGNSLAWEVQSNILPLLILPIARAFQPEKEPNAACRAAAADALALLCMRSRVKTTGLLRRGLSDLLVQSLQVDKSIEDCWDGCIATLRAIACCVSYSDVLFKADMEFWQDLCVANPPELFGPNRSELSDLDPAAVEIINNFGGIQACLQEHSKLLVAVYDVILGKCSRLDGSNNVQQKQSEIVLKLFEYVCKARVQFAWAFLAVGNHADVANAELQMPTNSQLTQFIGSTPGEALFPNPPPHGVETVRWIMGEMLSCCPHSSSAIADFRGAFILLESLVWISNKCNAFTFGMNSDGADVEWLTAWLTPIIIEGLTELEATKLQNFSLLEAELVMLISMVGLRSIIEPEWKNCIIEMCHDCSVMILKAGALPNLLNIFHTLFPVARDAGCTQSTPQLMRAMFVVETLWRDATSMLSSMASNDIGDVDEDTRQATIDGLREICSLPLRALCSSATQLSSMLPDELNISEWIHVLSVWLREDTEECVIDYFNNVNKSLEQLRTNGQFVDCQVENGSRVVTIVEQLLRMLLEAHSATDRLVVVVLETLNQLLSSHGELALYSGKQLDGYIHAIVMTCKIVQQRQFHRSASSSLVAARQLVIACLAGVNATFRYLESNNQPGPRQPVISLLTALSSVSGPGSLTSCAEIEQSLTTLLTCLSVADAANGDALWMTARQFYVDVFDKPFPLAATSSDEHRECGKRSTETSPAANHPNVQPGPSSTKKSHSFTDIIQARSRTPMEKMDVTFKSRSVGDHSASGPYLSVPEEHGSADSALKRRKTAPVTTYTSVDSSQQAMDSSQIQSDPVYCMNECDLQSPNACHTAAPRRQSSSAWPVLLNKMQSVVEEIDNTGCDLTHLDEAMALWSDVLHKLWALKRGPSQT